MRRQWDPTPCVGCGEPVGLLGRRGRCSRCYLYRHRTGYDRPAASDLRGTPRPCQGPGCECVTQQTRRGLCSACYMRYWRQTPSGRASMARSAEQGAQPGLR